MPDRPLIVSLLAVAWSLFHIGAGFLGPLPAFPQRGIHLAFGLVLVFLTVPAGRSSPRSVWFRALDALFAILSGVAAGYVAWDSEAILARSGSYHPYELWLGALLVVLVLEGTRRTLGWPLPVLALVALGYALAGGYLPGAMGHRGYSLPRILFTLYLSYDGIFGLILGVSASFVFLFVLFGVFIRESGAGQFFLGVAQALFGGVRGGSAKVAIVGSSLFGMISGSTVANVGTVGAVTIPLMRRTGFAPSVAAGVESAASVAGQLMPPVMGAAAFIMAEVLGIPYIKVAAAAALPAALYYFSLFVMVDLHAAKVGLRGLPPEERPQLRRVFRDGWTALIPVVVVVYLMGFVGYSPGLASVWAIASILGIALARRAMAAPQILEALATGALAALEVAMACACVGLIIGMVMLTGIGLKLSTFLVDLSGGSFLVLLVLTMLASLILGTALPTTATYVLLAVLVAPTITRMGVPPIAAHMFVFYFGVIADITPPTALCVYVACNIAGAPFQRTCWVACWLALAGFVLPFFFAYHPELVLIGTWPGIVLSAVRAAGVLIALIMAIQGYLLRPLAWTDRALAILGAFLLTPAASLPDLAGLACLAVLAARQFVARRRSGLAPTLPSPAVPKS